MVIAPNLASLEWLTHGFGERDSDYPAEIATLRQIHSCTVRDVSGLAGDRIAEGDALFTDRRRMLVGVRTADCVPVLLADTRTQKVAAVHAGWRGTAAEIATETLRVMGSEPRDVVAAIGPSIGGCCYEVGVEVAHQFGTWVPELGQRETPVKVDLKAINRLQLEQAGVANIWVSPDCTFCLNQYHSYRRDRDDAGRLVSFIGRR